MNNNSYVDFANFNYAYFEFQQQYRLLCEEVSKTEKDEFLKVNDNPIKKVSAIIKEYRVYIKNIDNKKYFDENIYNLLDEVENDINYKKLSDLPNKTLIEHIEYNKKYYEYIIKLFYIIGKFGDELSSSFFPTKSDRKKLLKYQNTNNFYEQFTKYKSSASKHLANFNIFNFKLNFTYIIGFYFAYYSYIDFESRDTIEKTMSNILNIYLSKEITKLLLEDIKNLMPKEKIVLKKMDRLLHSGLSNIFSRMSFSYADFGIMPKMDEIIKFDYTLI